MQTDAGHCQSDETQQPEVAYLCQLAVSQSGTVPKATLGKKQLVLSSVHRHLEDQGSDLKVSVGEKRTGRGRDLPEDKQNIAPTVLGSTGPLRIQVGVPRLHHQQGTQLSSHSPKYAPFLLSSNPFPNAAFLPSLRGSLAA